MGTSTTPADGLPNDVSVNVVAFQDEEGLWVAQCVEYDIVASAPSLPKLLPAFEKAFIANVCVNQLLGRRLLEGIPPSPSRFREMFDASRLNLTPEAPSRTHRLPVDVHAIRVADFA